MFPLECPGGRAEFPIKENPMTAIRDFHAHIYYDPEDVDRAKTLAAEASR